MFIKYFRWYVLHYNITIHSYPSKQQITHLIKHAVAITVTPTYNTTSIFNESLSHQFVRNVPYIEIDNFHVFVSFIVHTTTCCFVSK